MQIANGELILSLEHKAFAYGLTPGEVLMFHKLHFKNANGSPLGDIFVQKGEAQTVDVPEKAAEPEERNLLTGQITPAKAAVPAVTHKRTQVEEIARLKKKYTGVVTVDGTVKTAFAATFGDAANVKLPETFAEIADIVGTRFFDADEANQLAADKKRRLELECKGRDELVKMAIGLKLKFSPDDSKHFIIAAIINEENKAAAATKPAPQG